jgi:hypothetical protein
MQTNLRYQNVTDEEIAQQAEGDGSSEEDEEDGKKEETCAKVQIFESETKLRLHHQFCEL